MKRWFLDIAYCAFPLTADRELRGRLVLFNIFLLVEPFHTLMQTGYPPESLLRLFADLCQLQEDQR